MKSVAVVACLLAFVAVALAGRELCHTQAPCTADMVGQPCVCAGAAQGMEGLCTEYKGFEAPICVYHHHAAFGFPLTWTTLTAFDTVNDVPAHLANVEGASLRGGATATAEDSDPDSFLHKMWELYGHYRVSFDKEHASAEQAHVAFPEFVANYRYALNHNSKGEQSYEMGPNPFFDLSYEAFKAQYLNLPNFEPHTLEAAAPVETASLPEKVDWREKNVLSPVKTQGECGSCYAQSSVTVVESAWAAKTGSVVPLSVQQAVECSQAFGNLGCQGGMPENVYKYLSSGHGLVAEKDRPYISGPGGEIPACDKDLEKTGTYTVASFRTITGDESNLQAALAEAVCHVSVYVSRNFQLYKGGVLDDELCLDNKPNHAIVGAGYTTLEDKPVWILRNSWGADFGDRGYLYVIRNKNMCNVMAHPSTVTV